jgi:hypothetical protein
MKNHWRSRRGQRGQSTIELAFLSPIILLFLVGVGDMGYSLYQAHLATSLAREGSNLIARYATFDDTEAVLKKIASKPMTFDKDGVVILSVLKLGTDGANKGKAIITQRLRIGDLKEDSMLGDPPVGSFDTDPNHTAKKPDDDASLQATLPNDLKVEAGQSVYVTEVHQVRRALIRREMFNWALPATLSSSAFF